MTVTSSPYIHFYELGDKCVECGTSQNVEIHHKDRNRKNNNIENLMLLCHKHHMAQHTKPRPKTGFLKTTIRIYNKTKSRLDKYKIENESYEDVILRLLKEHEK